jgi:hypothetical protein
MSRRGRGSLGVMCKACKRAARSALEKVWRAVRKGLIARLPDGRKCADCDALAVVWEHRDYRKPYEVNAVCVRCNKKRGSPLRKLWGAAVKSARRLEAELLHY